MYGAVSAFKAVFRVRDSLKRIRILGSVHWITDPDPAPSSGAGTVFSPTGKILPQPSNIRRMIDTGKTNTCKAICLKIFRFWAKQTIKMVSPALSSGAGIAFSPTVNPYLRGSSIFYWQKKFPIGFKQRCFAKNNFKSKLFENIRCRFRAFKAAFRIRDNLKRILILGSVHWITDPDPAPSSGAGTVFRPMGKSFENLPSLVCLSPKISYRVQMESYVYWQTNMC